MHESLAHFSKILAKIKLAVVGYLYDEPSKKKTRTSTLWFSEEAYTLRDMNF